MGAFDISCGKLSNIIIISILLRVSDMDSENMRLIWLSVPDGKKTCNSKGVSLIGI